MSLNYRGIFFAHVITAQGGASPLASICATCQSSASRPSLVLPSSSLWNMKSMSIHCVFRNIKKAAVFGEHLGTTEGIKEQSYYRSGSMAQGQQSPPLTVKGSDVWPTKQPWLLVTLTLTRKGSPCGTLHLWGSAPSPVKRVMIAPVVVVRRWYT